jgi:hypothetical protein
MSQPQTPHPAKLVIGVLLKHRPRIQSIARDLVDRFGAVDMLSPWYDFDFTDYYAAEMGAPLLRRIFVFKNLIGQEELVRIKQVTLALEQETCIEGRRAVNIDPGYLTRERFVLATGKNFTHRIYLSQGIYADLTLIYQKGAFRTLPWTYPDYASQPLQTFLEQVRRRYVEDLKGTFGP